MTMPPITPIRRKPRLVEGHAVPSSAPIRTWQRTGPTRMLTADERRCLDLGLTLPELREQGKRLLIGERPEP